eukprot:3139137-Rhodomonas_salina.1
MPSQHRALLQPRVANLLQKPANKTMLLEYVSQNAVCIALDSQQGCVREVGVSETDSEDSTALYLLCHWRKLSPVLLKIEQGSSLSCQPFDEALGRVLSLGTSGERFQRWQPCPSPRVVLPQT